MYYLGSTMIMGKLNDYGSTLCRFGTQYATSIVL